MTIIYVAENNCQGLAVTFKKNGMKRVRKLEDVSGDDESLVNQMLLKYITT